MELLEFLPALNELTIGAIALVILAWIFNKTLDRFQEQSAMHDAQVSKMVEALSDNNDKLSDLIMLVKQNILETQHHSREQDDKIDDIHDKVEDISEQMREIKEQVKSK